MDKLLSQLAARLHVRDWKVVIKALLLLHRFINEGSENTLNLLSRPPHRNALIIPPKEAGASARARHQLRVLRAYAAYLEEAVVVWDKAHIRLTDDLSSDASGAPDVRLESPDSLLSAVELTDVRLGLLERATEVPFDRESVFECGATSLHVYRMLADDARVVFLAVTYPLLVIVSLVEHVDVDELRATSALQPKIARRVLDTFTRYAALCEKLREFFERLRDPLGRTLNIEPLPSATVENLTGKLRAIANGTPMPASARAEGGAAGGRRGSASTSVVRVSGGGGGSEAAGSTAAVESKAAAVVDPSSAPTSAPETAAPAPAPAPPAKSGVDLDDLFGP